MKIRDDAMLFRRDWFYHRQISSSSSFFFRFPPVSLLGVDFTMGFDSFFGATFSFFAFDGNGVDAGFFVGGVATFCVDGDGLTVDAFFLSTATGAGGCGFFGA